MGASRAISFCAHFWMRYPNGFPEEAPEAIAIELAEPTLEKFFQCPTPDSPSALKQGRNAEQAGLAPGDASSVDGFEIDRAR